MKTKQEIMADLADSLKSVRDIIHEDAQLSPKEALVESINYSIKMTELSILVDIRDILKEFIQELK
jgi:hypothetical protein